MEQRDPVSGEPASGDPAPDDGAGLGGRTSGPSFLAPSDHRSDPAAFDPPLPNGPPQGPSPHGPSPAHPYRPPARRLPAVVTLVAVALVATVVAVASVVAARQDVTDAAASPSATRRTTVPSLPPDNQIPFSSSYGEGVFTITDYAWSPGRRRAPEHVFLELQIQLTITRGDLDVDPNNFQAFDARGGSHLISAPDDGVSELAPVVLTAGQSTTGMVTFDVPRGAVTVILTEDGEAVAALRIRG